MGVVSNSCWRLYEIFNRIGYRTFMLCLWLIRLSGGLPYTWRYEHCAGDKKPGVWGPEMKSSKVPFVLVRKRVLVAWSSVTTFIVCITTAFVVLILMANFGESTTTAKAAILLKSLVDSMACMGLICHLRMKEALLARLLCVLYGLVNTTTVPYTMNRSWMLVASVLTVQASLIIAFVTVVQQYPLQDIMSTQVNFLFISILKIVMISSMLSVLLLLHYVTLLMAMRYNEVSCSFQSHASDLVPAMAAEAMVVTGRDAAQPSYGQRVQQLNPSNKSKMTLSYSPKPSLESSVMHTADTNIQLVYNLQQLQRLLNEYFSIPVLLLMTRSITSLVFLFFYVVMDPESMTFLVGMQALQEAASIVLICLSSETVLEERRKLKSILCCLKVFCSDFLQNKLSRFLELMNDDPSFNVSGYFMLAKNCLIPILSFIATYLVILIQFYVSESGCRGHATLPATNAINGTNFTDAAETDSSFG